MDDVTSGADAPDSGGDHGGEHRRDFLKKVSIGAAAAWSAPLLLSTQAAQAQGTVPLVSWVDASDSSATGSSLLIAHPAGVVTGDRLLAIIATDPATTSPLGAPGWTELATQSSGGPNNNVRTFLLTMVATGSGGSSTFTRGATDPGTFRGAIVAYRGVAAIGTPTSSVDSSPTGTHTFPAVTTTGSNDQWIIRLGGLGSTVRDWNAPPSGTSRVDSGNADRALAVFDSVQASPGTEPTVTLANTGGNTRAGLHTIALRPT